MNDGGDAIRYQACRRCGAVWYFRRTRCHRCDSAEIDVLASAGRATIAARTVVTRAPSVALRALAPYCIVLVDVDEGFRMMAHADPSLAIGDRARVGWHDFADRRLPRFEPMTPDR